jgi:hypothetical protein
MLERSRAMGEERGSRQWVVWRLTDLAEGELIAGRTEAGERYAREALAHARALSHRSLAVFSLSLLAWAAVRHGDLHRAAALWASLTDEHAKRPVVRWNRHRDRHVARMPEDLPTVDPMPLEQAIEYGLAHA